MSGYWSSRDDPEVAARALVFRHGWNAVAYQILNPGMQLWFASGGDAVAGYVTHGRTRVVAGAPICDLGRLRDVTMELEADANARAERVLFFAAGSRLEQVLSTGSDHRMVLLGAQPVWDPAAWQGIVQGKASLRAQLNRARNKGVQVEEWPPARATGSPVLRGVLRDWLSTRGLPPLAFLVTPDLLDDVRDRRIFVATRKEEVVGFLIATPVPARDGWLVEEWPRARSAPNGTTHLLVDAAMRALADDGSRYVTLGLVPLAEHADAELTAPPAWLRLILRWVRAHGRRFYNFRGLEAFKASMQPMEWEPIYAIAQGKRFTPRMLRAVAGAFSGGSPELLVVRALANAFIAELRRIGASVSRSHVRTRARVRPSPEDRRSTG